MKLRKILRYSLLILISIFIALSFKLHYSGQISGNLTVNYIDDFYWTDILIFCGVFGALLGLVLLVKKFYKPIQGTLIKAKKYSKKQQLILWLGAAGILLLCWLPYILSFAPGSVLGDSFASITQIFDGHFSNHHPLFFTLLVGIFVRIGQILGNINIGIFLFSCFQALILALALSYVLLFLLKRGVRIVPVCLVLAFFAFFPVFPSYAIIMWKDPLFSIALLALGLLLLKIGEQNFQIQPWQGVALVLVCLGVAFLRNNGLYILILLIPILLIFFWKARKLPVILISSVVCFALIIQGPVYSLLKIDKPSVEAFGIPLQQIAYTLTTHQEQIPEDKLGELSKIMPIQDWRQAYTPFIVDSIKWSPQFHTEYFESHLGSFFKSWISILPQHFGDYTKAFLLETAGFWHPIYQNPYGYIDQYISLNDYGIHNIDIIQKVTGSSIKEQLQSFRPMISTGLLAIIMLFSLTLATLYQKRSIALLYLPSLLCWGLIMVSTPVAFSLRYVFILMMMLPIFVFCPFFVDRADAVLKKHSAPERRKKAHKAKQK